MSRVLLVAVLLFAIAVAPAFTYAADGPKTYVPQMHPTYREKVSRRRKLAHGESDPLTKAASAGMGLEVMFCIRLKRNMRRVYSEFLMNDEGGQEHRLYGTRNYSERRNTAVPYGTREHPFYVAFAAKPPSDDFSFADPLVVTFTTNTSGEIVRLGQASTEYSLVSEFYVTDLTGDGLIDVAAAGGPGVSGGGGVSCFSILPDGALKETGFIPAAYGAASIVDLNNDGRWEIESQEYISYEGARGSYMFNMLYQFDSAADAWKGVTDRYPRAVRQQRGFYEELLAQMESYEERTGDRTPMDFAPENWPSFLYRGTRYRLGGSFQSCDVRELLAAWDSYASN